MSAQIPGVQQARTALSAEDPREIGGYRLHARLGAGGMGVVYLAYTPGGRPIALKAVRAEFAGDPEFRQRFAQEVASARRIHGLFTAQVVDSGADDPTPWLATAYVPGPSLQQVVQRHGPLPERTVLLLVAGIAEALQAIHRAGVVHRDLKPANVLIAEDGPRVIDFGIARAADAAALTGTGLTIGTAAFMAPEQALGRPVTAATDVFALGALAAYVAGGAAPFGPGPESTALYRVVHEHPDLTRVPPGLQELVWRCLAKQPEDRPTTGDLIAAVHMHPLVGPQVEFGRDWLPHPVSSEIAGQAGGPAQTYRQGHEPAYEPAYEPARASAYEPAHQPTYQRAHQPAHPSEYQPAYQPTVMAPAAAAAPDPQWAAGPRTDPHGGPATGPRTDGYAAPAPGPPADPRGRRAPKGGHRLRVAALAAAALVLGGGAVYYLDSPPAASGPPAAGRDGAATPAARPSAPAPSAPAPAAGYAPGAKDVELTSPDAGYEFDLKAGKVVPEETAAWYLARNAKEFVLSEDSDAFIAAGDDLGPADCVRGIETEPVTVLAFADLGGERPFCVRSADRKDIAVLRLVAAPAGGDEAVTVVIDRYHRNR